MSNRPNLGWIFYRKAFDLNYDHFYDDNDEIAEHTRNIREELTGATPHDTGIFETRYKTEIKQLKNPHCNSQFELVTIYPGLLAGSGYNHEAGLEGEFKLGFYFDHTTGLPVIPGSSVKGALRRVFPSAAGNKKDRCQKRGFLKWMLQETNKNITRFNEREETHTGIPLFEAKGINLDELERQMFEGTKTTGGKEAAMPMHQRDQFTCPVVGTGQGKEAAMPMHQRDLFYDAYPVRSMLEKNRNDSSLLLGNDYITPHKHKDRRKAHLDALTEPTPVQFLKVLPGVIFRFQFNLKNGPAGVTRRQKEMLFRHILLTLGIGSKTNVGYGQFLTVAEFSKRL